VSYPLGRPVALTEYCYDAAGVLANSDTATLVITLPDGTTTSPTVANPPSTTGTYTGSYTPTQPGLHTVRWVFAGTVDWAPPVDSFYVDAADLPPLCSLPEARSECGVSSTAEDELLQRYVRVASSTCEQRTRVWRRQTLTDVRDGGEHYVRLRRPVISVTSVTETDVAVTSEGYVLDGRTGLLYRGTMLVPWRWTPGRANITVTYVAGAADGVVPEEIRQGVLMLVKHQWNSVRGGSGLPRQAGGDNWDLPPGFFVPNAVLECWDPWIDEPVA
jgi:hypothetical protein